MFGNVFYFGLIRKYIILAGTLFNDIHIERDDIENNVTQLLKIPLSYSPKEKMLARIESDPDIQRESAVTLPRIAFELRSMSYASERKMNTISYIAEKNDTNANVVKYQYREVPYDFNFQISIYVKNAEDGTRIVEQILPYFTPDWTSTVQLIPEMKENKDIPMILQSIDQIEDTYSGDFKNRRAIVWVLNFVMKGYLYGPIKKNKVIKFANTTFRIPPSNYVNLTDAIGNSPANDRVTVQPGLDANGNPTSNISNSIPRDDINIDDPYGIIEEISGIILNE
jgi:hypothetical protein